MTYYTCATTSLSTCIVPHYRSELTRKKTHDKHTDRQKKTHTDTHTNTCLEYKTPRPPLPPLLNVHHAIVKPPRHQTCVAGDTHISTRNSYRFFFRFEHLLLHPSSPGLCLHCAKTIGVITKSKVSGSRGQHRPTPTHLHPKPKNRLVSYIYTGHGLSSYTLRNGRPICTNSNDLKKTAQITIESLQLSM